MFCVTGVLFASFGNKLRRMIDLVLKKCCGVRGRGRDGQVKGDGLASSNSLEMRSTRVSSMEHGSVKDKGIRMGTYNKDRGEKIVINPLMAINE